MQPDTVPTRSYGTRPQGRERGSRESGTSFSPGTLIQRYELIRELGHGGMGEVYLARDTQLGRRIAIKFLSPRYLDHAARFLVEARATAQCHHENIVVIHEVAAFQGIPFMALEYLEGLSLDRYLEDRSLPAAKAVEMIVPVVRAVVHAHGYGIIHRDLKPENIFATSSGAIKVLDFGIAKSLGQAEPSVPVEPQPELATSSAEMRRLSSTAVEHLTEIGVALGTAPYMAPEQWSGGDVDGRADLWAIGLILYRMVAGRHPREGASSEQYREWAQDLERPVVSVGQAVPSLPDRLVAVIDRCLRKRREERFESAQELLRALEPLMPARYGRASASPDECPYPGLGAFQQSDADRFFGRAAEIQRALAWLPDHPLVAIVAPSGVGKSSFVRAGLMPALRASGEAWEMLSMRPGRHAIAALAGMIQGLVDTSVESRDSGAAEQEALARRLRAEPGYLGVFLRLRVRRKQARILLFVDQFEELYTLVPDVAERVAFANCLLAAADDPASPVRVVLSMRSDFLDRVAEHPTFAEELTSGLVLLPPLTRDALREALVQPAELNEYRFEDEAMVATMVDELATTPGALSLLQFAAARLWDSRDARRRLLTRASYEAIGGIAGTLAAHADATLAAMTPAAQKLARAVFQRLVTPDHTRAIVDLAELTELAPDRDEVKRLIDQLIRSRLLVSDTRGVGGEAAVELVHESLIVSWPTLRRWLDESQENAAFLAQLREVARLWDNRRRPVGLLWRGETLEEARRFVARYRGELPARERGFLDAAFAVATRAARFRRGAIVGTFALLACLAVGASVALVSIRQAEQAARKAGDAARHQASVAQTEAQRALAAERKISEQLELIRAKEAARQEAVTRAVESAERLTVSHAALEQSNRAQHDALVQANEAARRAAAATEAERALREQMGELLEGERERVKELERQRGKIIDDLR